MAAYRSNGDIVIGSASDQTTNLRRLQSFGNSSTTIGVLGKKPLPSFTLPNGTVVTIVFHGGAGTVSSIGNTLQFTLTGAPSIVIRTKGGANAVGLSSIAVTGSLRSLVATSATLSGVLSCTGNIGVLTLGAITGVVFSGGGIGNLRTHTFTGSISAAGVLGTINLGQTSGVIAAHQIKNFTAASLVDAVILAGANLGADDSLGGADDSFDAGQLLAFKVTGSITTSLIAAGAIPGDGLIGAGNDTSAGAGSGIHSILVKGGTDSATRFESPVFPRVAVLPKKVIPGADARFVILK